MSEDMDFFNKEDVYDNEISPLMQKIIAVCKKHDIPMLASFTFENCEERCTTYMESESRTDQALDKALKVIRSGGHQTFAVAITAK
jgi:hypothetical protein